MSTRRFTPRDLRKAFLAGAAITLFAFADFAKIYPALRMPMACQYATFKIQ